MSVPHSVEPLKNYFLGGGKNTYFPGSEERKAQGLSDRSYCFLKTNKSFFLERLADIVNGIAFAVIISGKTLIIALFAAPLLTLDLCGRKYSMANCCAQIGSPILVFKVVLAFYRAKIGRAHV